MSEWTVYQRIIEEDVVPGKRLGRHVRHDSRSLAYPWVPARRAAPASVLHARNIAILDQGAVGSCTGNAETGALGTSPLFETLAPIGKGLSGEATALALYSAAETIDGDGPYPPNDNGSSGTSVCQAALNAGFVSGYTHCMSVADVVGALQDGPVIIGISWYSSFDSPDASGLVTISAGATVRGGHEIVVRGVDVTAQTFFLDNSWGTGWGAGGSFTMGWATLDRLLHEGGDATVNVPVTVPAPAPVPVPVPVADPDAALWAVAGPWTRTRRVRPDLAKLKTALTGWAAAKHL